jgi:hypothetical protein
MNAIQTNHASARNVLGEWKSPYATRYGSDFNDYRKSRQYFGYKYATWTTAKGPIALLMEDSKQHELAITIISPNEFRDFPSDYQAAVKHAAALCGIMIP